MALPVRGARVLARMLIPADRLMLLARRLREQGLRYVRSLVWLVKDSIGVAPREWLRILVATLFNLGSNAAIAGAIYTYVKLLQHDLRINVLGISIVARESALLLVLFILAFAAAVLLYGASEYIAKAAALKLHRRYQEFSLKRSLKLMQALPDPRCPQLSALLETVGRRKLAVTYPYSCGWSLRFIGNASPSIILFVVGFGALIWLDPSTTALVSVLGLGVVAAQYPIHLLAARSSNTFEETDAHVSAQVRGLLDLVSDFDNTGDQQALDARLADYCRDERVKRNADANEDRYRSMELSALAMRTGGGLILAAMLLTVGSGLLSETADWAILLAYATLLRQLLNSVTTIFRTVTVFSRFSPHVQIYRRFVVDASVALSPPPAPPPVPDHLSINVRSDDGAERPLRLERGASIAFFNPGSANRDLILLLQGALYEAQRGTSVPIPEILPMRFGPSDVGDPIAQAIDEVSASDAGILLIDQRSFRKLPWERREEWQERIVDRYLIYVYDHAASTPFGESLALVRDRADALHEIPIPTEGLSEEDLQRIKRLLKSGAQRAAPAAADEVLE